MAELDDYGAWVKATSHIELPVAQEKVEAGFPAPNGGYIDGGLDVNEFLVHHPNFIFIEDIATKTA